MQGGVIAQVGVRELRNGLSRWLARVQAGEDITVTDHGRPVARIVAASSPAYDALIKRGLILPAARRHRDLPLPDPLPIAGPVSDLVGEQRR